jgi:hypothetical protein
MGTSSPYGGHKDSNQLLPHDYNDDDPNSGNSDTAPDTPPVGPQPPLLPKETPWKDVKTAMSYYITGRTSSGGNGVNHVMRSYGRAAGRTAGMMRTSSSGIKTGHVLSQFLSNSLNEKDSVFDRVNDILRSEAEIKTALSKIADVISPIPEGKEDAVAREAIIHTLCELYDYIDANNLDMSSLSDLDSSLQEQLFTTYVSAYVWGRMLNDLQVCFEKNAETTGRAAEVEKDFKDYIYAKVSVEVHKGIGNPQANARFDVEKIFHDCYEVLM